MKTLKRRRLPYTCFSVGAYGLISLFFALMNGRISRRGPDIFEATDPSAFRTRLIMYALVGFVSVIVGLLVLLWQVWHTEA